MKVPLKKTIAAALFLALALNLFGGCAEKRVDYQSLLPEVSNPAPEYSSEAGAPAAGSAAEISILYNTADFLNPYLLRTKTNSRVSGLLYEGLFALDENFRAQELLCKSWSAEDNRNYSFTIYDDLYFSSGAQVTAADVIYSINLARSSNLYSSRLSAISNISLVDPYTLEISLSSANASLPSLLDVPVIPFDSEAEPAPAGTGPYVLSEDGGALVANPYRRGAYRLPAERITLAEYAEDELISAFETGKLSAVVSDPVDVQLNFGGNYEKFTYNTTSMLFVGFNCNEGMFEFAAPRRAMSKLIDRRALAEAAFPGAAAPTCAPISPGSYLWSHMLDEFYELAPLSAAETLFTYGASYRTINIIVRSSNRAHTEAAKYIAARLEAAGLKAKVREMSRSQYETALSIRDFDIFIGETILAPDFDISPLITYGASANPGYYNSSECSSLLAAFLAADEGEKLAALEELCSYLADSSPFMTLAFRTPSLLTSRGTLTNACPTQQNVFHSIKDWSVS